MPNALKLPNLTRRTWLLGGAAVIVGAGALGGAWIGFSSPRDLVFALMQRALPGVDLDPVSGRLCAQEVVDDIDATFKEGSNERLVSTLKLKGVRAASNLIGTSGVAGLGPFEERLEEITRMAVTRLLPNSNFFSLADPRAETIVYVSPDPNAACVNPFANLTPPNGPQSWPVR